METRYRQIHPEVRVLDEARGLVSYVASDESLDSYQEVVRAKGWRFDLFKKNSPFVDSHNYDTIENLVGKVTEVYVQGGKLIANVQWAIDAPDNRLARLGWQMTKAGYLKAVSVGFRPVKYVTPSESAAYKVQLRELALPQDNQPRVIYTEHQLLELSSVIIGANSNALLEAHKAGAIKDADVEMLRQRGVKAVFQIPFREVSRTSQPISSPMSKADFQSKTLSLMSPANGDTPQRAADSLRKAQRSQSDVDMERSLRRVLASVGANRQRQLQDEIGDVLDADPGLRGLLNALPRKLMNLPMTSEQEEVCRVVDESTLYGSGGMGPVASPDIFNLLAQSGKFATLSVQPVVGGRRGQFPVVTAWPNAAFINEGAAIPRDSAFAGTFELGVTKQIASLVDCSLGLFEDATQDVSALMLEALTQAIGHRLDTACFIGDGVADADNGEVTGIFVEATIPQFTAASGHTTLELFDHDDFSKAMEEVDAATLQRPCRWWVSSALLPALLRCKSDSGAPLLEFHPSAGGFHLLGFPVTLVAVAPSTNSASQKVLAFGDPRSFVVPMSHGFRLVSSDTVGWTSYLRSFRALTRATGKLRNAAGFTILSTAAA